MLTSTTIHTAHGYAIRVRRVGLEVEFETSSAVGDVISTVRMTEAEAVALLEELDDLTEGLWEQGYDAGYENGKAAA